MKQNRIIALVILAFVIWWAYLTAGLPESTVPNEPGPKFFPTVILICMAILRVVLFFQKDPAKKEEEKGLEITLDDGEVIELPPPEKFPMKDALKLFAVFLGGIILIYFFGFNIGLIVSLTIMLWMIGWKLFPRALVFSAVVTLVVYFIFDWLLKISLPVGRLFY